MLRPATLDKHRKLVALMAEALGLDFEILRQKGRLPEGQVEAAVRTCTGCARAESCATWLMEFTATPEETPGFCRNRTRFAALKAGT